MTSNPSLLFCEIAQRLIGRAVSYAHDELKPFWEFRYNCPDYVVSDRINGERDGETAIHNTFRFAYFEAVLVILGNDGISPYNAYVIEHFLEFAKSEFPGFKDAHERAKNFFVANWNPNVPTKCNELVIVADWLCHELLKEPNDVAKETFTKRIKQLRIECYDLFGDYFGVNEKD